VDPFALWRDLGMEPELSSVDDVIPAAMEELVAWRWRHPTRDTRSS
jgi:hypothetical protein